jgi:hypothetical protein
MSDRPTCPTASELPRIYQCPGYLRTKRALNLPRQPDSEDAASGTRCHAAYAGDTSAKLTDDEEISVARAVRMTDTLAADLGFTAPPIMERRLYCGTSFSGQPDRIYIDGKRAFVPDAKFGRNAVEDAESNKQFRGYVALVAYNWPELTEIYVAPIQPWVTSKPVPALYGIEEIGQTLAEVFGAIGKSDREDAPRIAGKHCKYCPLQGVHCAESRHYAIAPVLANGPEGITPAAVAGTLTNENLASFLARIPQAEDVFDAIRAEAKRRLQEDPASVLGWTLKPGRITETITDPEAVFARAEKLGVTQKAFMATVSIGKEKLKAAIKSASGLKGKDLEIMLDSVTLGCTTAKQAQASLAQE